METYQMKCRSILLFKLEKYLKVYYEFGSDFLLSKNKKDAKLDKFFVAFI